jgi:hypothetical protein
MQTVSFYCPHCKNLMGVGTDLLGQQVQCPSCRAMVIAPETAEPMVSFDGPKLEHHESIFSEHQDEDLFGSAKPNIEIPPAAEPPANESRFAAYPPDMPQSEAGEMTVAAESPVIDVPPSDAPVLAPDHWPTASEPESPEPPPPPSWEPQAESINWAPSESDAAEVQALRRAPMPEHRKGANLLLTILAPYAVVMTAVAGWYFYRATYPPADQHPMANIPDIFAQYEPATRHRLNRGVAGMPAIDAPLPAGLLVRLGETIAVGDLEVTPERVAVGPLKVHTVLADDSETTTDLPGQALILRLRVRNRSSDVYFHPTDPVFDRLYDRRQGSAKPYTQLIAGNYHSYGGAIDVLGTNWQKVKRKYVDGQEYDDKPLPPGEDRHTVVVTDPQDTEALAAVRGQSGGEPITWRVQLRRGLTTFRGQELSTCAVIGVQFSASDVK